MGNEMICPDALAGAVGAEERDLVTTPLPYRLRQERATTLSMAILDSHPKDAVVLCSAFLEQNCAGAPNSSPFEALSEEARDWARYATPIELIEYLEAILRELELSTNCLMARKRLFLILWDSFSAKDQTAFMARTNPYAAYKNEDR
jgi:hypothetical protein